MSGVTGDPLTALRRALTSEGAQSRYLLARSRWDEFQAGAEDPAKQQTGVSSLDAKP